MLAFGQRAYPPTAPLQGVLRVIVLFWIDAVMEADLTAVWLGRKCPAGPPTSSPPLLRADTAAETMECGRAEAFVALVKARTMWYQCGHDRCCPLFLLVLRLSHAAGGGRVALSLKFKILKHPEKPPATLAAFLCACGLAGPEFRSGEK
jgi:hypothetical protein